MHALALTDHGNMHGAIDFYKTCKEFKIKPLIGCEFYFAPNSRFEKKRTNITHAYHLVLLAKNSVGYHNLCKLSSLAYTEGFYYDPRIDFELLGKYHEGLICLSACLKGPFAQTIMRNEDPRPLIQEFSSLFKEDLYLEIQDHHMSQKDIENEGFLKEQWLFHKYEDLVAKQKKVNDALIQISDELHIPLVATNDCHYIEREDWRAHEVFINIQSGEPCEIRQENFQGRDGGRIPNPKRFAYSSHEHFLKSQEMMHKRFSHLPQALETTCEIADKCDLKIDFSSKHYPVFHPPGIQKKVPSKERKKAVNDYLEKLCYDAIEKRYPEDKLAKVGEQYPGKDPLDVVKSRLEEELHIISSKDLSDYLLIVWDFIHWAKNQGIPMGPGRGSGAGSIICYLTGITDIEPLRFNLFFERFINPERLSYPDIDVDICMHRRNEVINYTIEKYGKMNVAQIITFGSMKAKMVIRDVGRTLSVPLNKVNAIAKMIPEELNITIDDALEKSPDLKEAYANDDETKQVIDIGRILEGSLRSTGLHAAGLIVAEKPLMEYIPICTAKDADMLATQYSMKPAEMVGMLKIDFLGLKTLTSIQICQNALHQRGIAIDWTSLPLEDAKTFDLLNHGKTNGVFQLESGGMQELSKNLHLDKFEEIIAVLSLYRPGPMEMIPSFIARKHKKEPIEYDHPWMESILSETYGIMVYQEQVMQIASRLANYSLGEADVLRRAMGKKDAKQMAKEREKFVSGCLKNDISEECASKIFDKMEKFAEYGFNKSHATAYGYITYVTAYLKAHYPSEWLAALMTCDKDDTTKIAKFTYEGAQMGIQVLPPDVNESDSVFAANEKGIRFALTGIKGVGGPVVETLIQERKANGPFENLYNFIERVDSRKVGKKALELLIDAGCFDFTSWHRDQLKASLDASIEEVQRNKRDSSLGYMSLFDDASEKNALQKPPKLASLSAIETLLFREKELLGFFLSGHPLSTYKEVASRLGCVPFSSIADATTAAPFRIMCVIDEVSTRISNKTQKKFAFISVSDAKGSQFELPIWADLYEQAAHLLIENKMLVAVVTKEQRNGQWQMSCKWLEAIENVKEATLTTIDHVYDKAKDQIRRAKLFQASGKEKKKGDTTPPPPKKPKKQKKVTLTLLLDMVKMSHIMEIKKLLEEKKDPSQPNIEVLLKSKKKEVCLHIDPSLFLPGTDAIKEKLHNLPCFYSLKS